MFKGMLFQWDITVHLVTNPTVGVISLIPWCPISVHMLILHQVHQLMSMLTLHLSSGSILEILPAHRH